MFVTLPASLSILANSTAGFKARSFRGVRVQIRSVLFSKPPQIRLESSENVTAFKLHVRNINDGKSTMVMTTTTKTTTTTINNNNQETTINNNNNQETTTNNNNNNNNNNKQQQQ